MVMGIRGKGRYVRKKNDTKVHSSVQASSFGHNESKYKMKTSFLNETCETSMREMMTRVSKEKINDSKILNCSDDSSATVPLSPSGSSINQKESAYSADDTEFDSSTSDDEFESNAYDGESICSNVSSDSFAVTSNGNLYSPTTSSSKLDCKVSMYSREHHEDLERNEKALKEIHQKACRYLRTGRLKEALKQFDMILGSLVKDFGRTHERVGTALHNVGVVHLRSGNLNEALDVIKEAIKIRRKKLGKFHSKVSESLVELGILLLSKNSFDEALEIFEDALEIQERQEGKAEGKDRTKVVLQKAKILNNIGCVHFESGDIVEAMEAYEESLLIQREIFKKGELSGIPSFLALSTTISNLGYVYMDKSDWELAIFQLEDALQIQKSILVSKGHKVIVNTLQNIGYAAVKDGNYDTALRVYEEILEIEKSKMEVNDINSVPTMKKIVYTKLKLCQHEEALDMLYDIEEIESESYLEEDMKETRNLISSVHYQSMKYPGLIELAMTALTKNGFRDPWDNEHICKCGNDLEEDEFDLRPCLPQRPIVRTKMSGHKISYA